MSSHWRVTYIPSVCLVTLAMQCVPGDVRSQCSGHFRDSSRFSLRERLRGEAGCISGGLRHRQRHSGRLLCRRGVVTPARRSCSSVVAENNQQRYVHFRRVFHLAPGCSVSCQVYRYYTSPHPFHHLHRPCLASNHLYHLDIQHGGRWYNQCGCRWGTFQMVRHGRVRDTSGKRVFCRGICGSQCRRSNADHHDCLRQSVLGCSKTGEIDVNCCPWSWRFHNDLRFQCAVGQESVRDLCCLLVIVHASDGEIGAEDTRCDATRRSRVSLLMGVHLVGCAQRDTVHRASLVRQKRATTLPPALSSSYDRPSFDAASWRRYSTELGRH